MFKHNILAIRSALEDNFAFSEDIASVLELALVGKKNVLLYGPGGHAKSMMMDVAMKAAGIKPFVKSFSEGTTVDDIYGGLDIPAYTKGELKHLTQNSFLNSEVAIFEELFDAPAATLCSLKDTLTAHAFRAGAEYCPSKCTTIIALTNVNPAEIEALGAAQKALIERFPLQLEVKWKDYSKEAFKQMLNKVYGNVDETAVNILSRVCEDAKGNISPRTCCHMFDSLNAYRSLHGNNLKTEDYMRVLTFFNDVDSRELKKICNNLIDSYNSKKEIEKYEAIIKDIIMKYQNNIYSSTTENKLTALKAVKQYLDGLENVYATNDTYDDKQSLISMTEDFIRQATSDILS